MKRSHLISIIAGLLAGLRADGGGVGRIGMRDGLPAFTEAGIAALVPADMTDSEIDRQAKVYAGDLMEGRSAQ